MHVCFILSVSNQEENQPEHGCGDALDGWVAERIALLLAAQQHAAFGRDVWQVVTAESKPSVRRENKRKKKKENMEGTKVTEVVTQSSSSFLNTDNLDFFSSRK